MFLAGLILLFASGPSSAQQIVHAQTSAAGPQIIEPQTTQQAESGGSAASASAATGVLPDAPTPDVAPAHPQSSGNPSQQQPKRILGIMPNYRAVSAGAIPPPPGPKQAFVMATENSFDYSAFIFVGVTSLLAEGDDAHPALGKGVGGYWAYSWRGFLDKTDGNYLVMWAFPTVFHEDERYFAMGEGSIGRRALYAASSVAVARNYQGGKTFNFSEILGRGASQAVSVSYYPSSADTASALAQKYGYAIGRDALTNTFREFWPDISRHVLHKRPTS
ncbi:MAG: hypothetical protein WA294_06645 [Acidobacteriaceae bacterium]